MKQTHTHRNKKLKWFNMMISNGMHVIISIESFKHPFFVKRKSDEKKKCHKNTNNLFWIMYLFLSHWMQRQANTHMAKIAETVAWQTNYLVNREEYSKKCKIKKFVESNSRNVLFLHFFLYWYEIASRLARYFGLSRYIWFTFSRSWPYILNTFPFTPNATPAN